MEGWIAFGSVVAAISAAIAAGAAIWLAILNRAACTDKPR